MIDYIRADIATSIRDNPFLEPVQISGSTAGLGVPIPDLQS